jgi:galactokinase
MEQTQATSRRQDLEAKFVELFGSAPAFIVRAPGRVNLIGEHTDYNDGFVFPAAIERDVMIAASPRADRQVRAYALNFHQSSTFTLELIQATSEPRERWSNYLRAMAWVFHEEGLATTGLNCVILGNVPLGAGLSSSAAMLVASGLAFATAGQLELDPVRLAQLARRGENQFIGAKVGIMDQFISSLGQRNHALFIDTRALTYEAVPLPASGVSIVIADTNKKRPEGNLTTWYNERVDECAQAVAVFQKYLPTVRALRDVSVEAFQRYEAELPELARKRARHVVTEDARVLESVQALKAGDMARFGQLMNQSHDSLRDDYEVSCKELDALVEAARSVKSVYGARMTGAGFGGCTVSLVADDALDAFRRDVPPQYKAAVGLETTIYVTTAAQGAERIL